MHFQAKTSPVLFKLYNFTHEMDKIIEFDKSKLCTMHIRAKYFLNAILLQT